MWSTVNADNYAQTAERLYLLGVYNTADLSDGESEKMPAAIATDFIARMGDKYNVIGIQLIYADKNGMYDIEIRADTFQPLEYEQMLAATKKRPEKELPENYLEWRRGVRGERATINYIPPSSTANSLDNLARARFSILET